MREEIKYILRKLRKTFVKSMQRKRIRELMKLDEDSGLYD